MKRKSFTWNDLLQDLVRSTFIIYSYFLLKSHEICPGSRFLISKMSSFLIINKFLDNMNADSALFHVLLNYSLTRYLYLLCILSQTCGRQLDNLLPLVLIRARRLTSALPHRVWEMFLSFCVAYLLFVFGLYS